MSESERKLTRAEFARVVNMSPAELKRWLATEESRAVGSTQQGDRESIGHQSDLRILELKQMNAAELGEEDYAHMRKVIGYCHRHLAQRPDGDVTQTRWRYSLMNWGHDPLRD